MREWKNKFEVILELSLTHLIDVAIIVKIWQRTGQGGGNKVPKLHSNELKNVLVLESSTKGRYIVSDDNYSNDNK